MSSYKIAFARPRAFSHGFYDASQDDIEKLISIEGILLNLHWWPVAFKQRREWHGKKCRTEANVWRRTQLFVIEPPNPSILFSSALFALFLFIIFSRDRWAFFIFFVFQLILRMVGLHANGFIDYKPCSTNVKEAKEKHKVYFRKGGRREKNENNHL